MCSWTIIRRTEAADRAAKEAFEKEPTVDLMSFLDLKPFTAKYIHQVWQKEWDEAVFVSKKLHEISPKLSDKLLFCQRGKEGKVLNRLYTGHSCLTNSFILKKKKNLLFVLHVMPSLQSRVFGYSVLVRGG